MNVPAVLAAISASAAVCAHGIVGQRWFTAQLRPVALRTTKLWGAADIAWRVFAVSWHLVTAVFLASAVTLFLVAFEAIESRALPHFVAIVHAAFLGIGLVYFRKRLKALAQPFPALVVASLAGVSVFPWLA